MSKSYLKGPTGLSIISLKPVLRLPTTKAITRTPEVHRGWRLFMSDRWYNGVAAADSLAANTMTMHSIKSVGRCLLSVLVFSLALFSGAVALAQIHVGEDGIEYEIGEATGSPNSATRHNWLLGKIEPVLVDESAIESQLSVIVYVLRAPKGVNAQNPREIKAKHRRKLDAISDQIRAIHRRYKPSWSMGEFEEIQHMEVVDLAMSDEDRAELRTLKERMDQGKDVMRHEIHAAIKSLADENLKVVSDVIEQGGGSIIARLELTNAVGAQIPSSLLMHLAEHPLVFQVLKNRPTEYDLDVSVPALGYASWWNDDPPIEGYPYDFGIVDSGLVLDHPAFSCVNVFINQPESIIINPHGTHVAGIAISCDSTYQGGIQDVDAVIWANQGTPGGNQVLTMSNMDWMAGASQTPEVINHSLGYGIANVDDYNITDTFYDAFIGFYDIMVIKSAGNEGWGDDTTDCTHTDPAEPAPCITHPATAYNLMAVANMDDDGDTALGNDVRRTSSSVGPTVGGRRKPDITAPGTYIMSTNSEWDGATGADLTDTCGDDTTVGDDFIDCSGTSMAAPHVAAAIVLMEDGGNNIPMAQKAVLLNSTHAWTSNDTLTLSDDGPVQGSHWDMSYGWGYLSMTLANVHKDDYFAGSVIPKNDTASPDDYKLYKGQMFLNEKATLVWQKRHMFYVPGGSAGMYDLSDLNIRLFDETTGVGEDTDLDGNDNVHQVAATHGSSKVIKVYAWSTVFDGAFSESYALATHENFVEASPPTFSHEFDRPLFVGPDQTFDVTVRMFNNGDVAAHNNTLTITDTPGVCCTDTVSVPSITSGGGEQEAVFTLTTDGIAAGTHWLGLYFDSYSYLELYEYLPAYGVSLVVETTPPTSDCTSPQYENGTVVIDWAATDGVWPPDPSTGVKYTTLYVKIPGTFNFVYAGLSSTGTSGTFNYTAGADGQYQFVVRSVDNGGNWEALTSIADCQTFVDTAKPTSTLSTPSIAKEGLIPLDFSVTDPAPSSGFGIVYFWIKTDGGDWRLFYSSYDPSGQVNINPADGDGLYEFTSSAVDRAQNLECEIALGHCPVKSSTVYDTLPPTGSILINEGASTTSSLTVNLTLSATDAGTGVSEMRFSNNGAIWSPWEAYATSRSWNLYNYGGDTSQGIKTVYVQYADALPRVSPTYTDTITYVISIDTDNDGIPDTNDNCTLVINPAQRDTDGDNYGNYCDPDFDNSGIVNAADLAYLKTAFFTTDPLADLTGDGIVNAADLAILKTMFFGPPGPSCCAP